MNWKDILKSKKYEDMTDEEREELDRRMAEYEEERYRKYKEGRLKTADAELEAINERIRREQATAPRYFGLREMASIAGVEFPEGHTKAGKRRKRPKNKRELGLTDEEAKRIRAGVSPEEHKKILERGERRLREKKS